MTGPILYERDKPEDVEPGTIDAMREVLEDDTDEHTWDPTVEDPPGGYPDDRQGG